MIVIVARFETDGDYCVDNEALQLLREKFEALRFGWLKLASGYYAGTLLFMQKITDWRDEPTKPVL